jgi:arachidonate 15-lipoxygenase
MYLMKPFLPNADPNPENRLAKLNQRRTQYQYNFQYIESLPMLQNLPSEAYPSVKWLVLVGEAALKLFLNTIQVKKANDQASVSNLSETYLSTQKQLKSNEFDRLEFKSRLQGTLKMLDTERISGSGDSLDEYDGLFKAIPLPEIRNQLQSDFEFSRMRVAGPNPVVIERISALDARFPISDAQYLSVIPGDTLERAGKEGRLYIADYSVLSGVTNGNFPEQQKYIYAPLALFAVPPVGSPSRALVAVAIQCGQDPGVNPIFTPPNVNAANSEKWGWEVAKTIVQIADANYHELISHLGLTHLLIEPFAIATQRQLASAHPLGILLRAHFEGTLLINDLAQKFLTGAGDPVDALLAGTYQSSQGLSAQVIQKFVFNKSMLPETFKRRGVQDTGALPEYPYRDDALLIWEEIHKWVSDYLRIYYASDEDVQQDNELQAWLSELLSPDGGRIQGIGQDGQINTLEYLIDATTLIIFTASAQHAAVNFPQASIMSYAPAMPMAGYTLSPTSVDNVTEQDYFKLMPPIKQAQGQLNLTYLLGSVYYTRLGDYSSLVDSRVQDPLNKFQKNLKDVESKIVFRNATQSRNSYKFLMPSRIPQSINI